MCILRVYYVYIVVHCVCIACLYVYVQLVRVRGAMWHGVYIVYSMYIVGPMRYHVCVLCVSCSLVAMRMVSQVLCGSRHDCREARGRGAKFIAWQQCRGETFGASGLCIKFVYRLVRILCVSGIPSMCT